MGKCSSRSLAESVGWTKNPPRTINSTEAISGWLLYIQCRLSGKTYKIYSRVIRQYAAYLPEVPADTNIEHVERFLLSQSKAGLANRSVNNYLMAVKSFHRWLADRYDMPNPIVKIKPLRELPPKQNLLKPEQYSQILAVCTSTERVIIEFLAHTGLRSSEVCRLAWDAVDWENKRLSVHGKGRKLRVIPINSLCVAILKRLKPPKLQGYIFRRSVIYKERERFYAKTPETRRIQLAALKISWTHYEAVNSTAPIHSRFLYMLCCNAAQAAGIRIFGPHALRHYFATELLRRGVPISHVSKLLGHSSIRTTEAIYIHFLPSFLDGITEILVDKKN